jgi:hypothetical protein
LKPTGLWLPRRLLVAFGKIIPQHLEIQHATSPLAVSLPFLIRLLKKSASGVLARPEADRSENWKHQGFYPVAKNHRRRTME